MKTKRLPPWIRVRAGCSPAAAQVQDLLAREGLNTVCQGAVCPNRGECYSRGTATFMIMGDLCTRKCLFCAVPTGSPSALDHDEPRRVARAARTMRLRHVVVTSVTRDDLPDGGASHFAATIRILRSVLPGATVEVLTPHFKGRTADIATVLDAMPDVFNHNIETVPRLQSILRPAADYKRSISVLHRAGSHKPRLLVKSGIMVGLGESDAELFAVIADLFAAGCRALTIGQYLAPSRNHASVARYVTPATFDFYRECALAMGFARVASAPLVRSSYHAEEMVVAPRKGMTR